MEQSQLQTQKKKKSQLAKKQKHKTEIITTTGTTEETVTKSSLDEHALNETQESAIKTVPLNVAPEKLESLIFEEKITNMDIDSLPKSHEIQPIYHALNSTQIDELSERETHLHSHDIQKQTCNIHINESIPLYVTENEQSETVEIRKPQKSLPSASIPESIVIESSIVSNEMNISYDSVDNLNVEFMPMKISADETCIPHESKIISEQIVNIRETDLSIEPLPDSKRAEQKLITQNSIEVQAINIAETEKNINEKYQANEISADFDIIPNLALNVHEPIVENTPENFYPETFIATEEASPNFVTHIPYQTAEICSTESEKDLNLHETPEMQNIQISFNDNKAISTEQTNFIDTEIPFLLKPSTDLEVKATDSVTIQNQLKTESHQIVDTITPIDAFNYETKSAGFSIQENDSKIIELTNVLHTEKPFEDMTKRHAQQRAISNYTTHEGISISKAQIQENDTEITIEQPHLSNAFKTQEPYETFESNKQQSFDTIDEYTTKPSEKSFSAVIDFELQKSTIGETTFIHDSEQLFDTKIQENTPKFSIDSTVNNPLAISETQIQENESELSIEQPNQVKLTTTQEPHRTFEQNTEQLLDTAGTYYTKDSDRTFNAEIGFELQKSMFNETLITHDSEQSFETKTYENIPKYSFEPNVSNAVEILETQAHDKDHELNIAPLSSVNALKTQEPHKIVDLGEEQWFDTFTEDHEQMSKPTKNADINFELQRSIMDQITVAHDSEKPFDTVLKSNEPKYTINSNINNSISISVTNIQEKDTELAIETPITSNASMIHELHTAIESNNEQLLDTTGTCHAKINEPAFNTDINFELQKSTIAEIVQMHDSEISFETKLQENVPKYNLESNVNSSIAVTQLNILDSAAPYNAPQNNEQKLIMSQIPPHISHIGSVAETTLYDSIDTLELNKKKSVQAKVRPTASSNELSIEIAIVDENLSELPDRNVYEKYNAIQNVNAQNALEVTVIESQGSVDKMEIKTGKEQLQNVIYDLSPVNSLIVNEIDTAEQLTHIDIDEKPRELKADVSTESNIEIKSSETWPIEETQDFIGKSTPSEHISNKSITEKSAVEITSTITSDALDDFRESKEKQLFAKYSMDEMHGMLIQDFVANENVDENIFVDYKKLLKKGSEKQDVNLQHRCEQTRQNTFESANIFDVESIKPVVTGDIVISDSLIVANVDEINENVFESEFNVKQTKNYGKKKIHDNFNTIGQTVEMVALEKEEKTEIESIAKKMYPKQSFEELVSYTNHEERVLDKESLIDRFDTIDKQNVRITTDRPHSSANVQQIDSLENEINFKRINLQQIASQNIEKPNESVETNQHIVQEPHVLFSNIAPKTSKAKHKIDNIQTIQIEQPEVLEKEQVLSYEDSNTRKCEQSYGEQLKALTIQKVESIEQVDYKLITEIKNETANIVIDETKQNITFETVCLKDYDTIKASAQRITEKPIQAVIIEEQYPLCKENLLIEYKDKTILTKPKKATPKTIELQTALIKNEIHTFINKADITNKSIVKQIESKRQEGEEKGRF